VERAKQLAPTHEALESDREALTKGTLAFLSAFDADGKFKALGIPRPSEEITIDSDGTPSELLFCGVGSWWSREAMAPLCFDVTDFHGHHWFAFTSPGRLDLERQPTKWHLDLYQKDLKRAFFFKYPVRTMTHTQAAGVADAHLFPESMQQGANLFIRGPEGASGSSYLNIWDPVVREMILGNLRAIARYCRGLERFLFYDKLTWEPLGLVVRGKGDRIWEAGYSGQAIEAFRAYLSEKFGRIEQLNAAWGAEYADFGGITPPPDALTVQRTRATPLTYEWEFFRAKSYRDYLAACVAAIRKEDPGRQVVVEVDTMLECFVAARAGAWRTIQALGTQLIEGHYNNWGGSYPALNLLYSLCHYAGKAPVEMEYIWTYPRLVQPETEEDFRVTGELSVWRKMVWGRKILHVFGDFDGWGYRHNLLEERYCELGPTRGPTGHFVREAGAAIPMGKKRAREFWPYLRDTRIVTPKIAVLVPFVSELNAYPYIGPYSGYSICKTESAALDRIFRENDLDFRYVPEELVVDGTEELTEFRALVVPCAPYFPAGLAQKLLDWTKAGGTLIAAGVPGIYDPYGFHKPELMDGVFGSALRYDYTGDHKRWRWGLDPRGKTAVIVSSDDRTLLVEAKHGEGAMLVAGESFSSQAHGKRLAAAVVQRLRATIGRPTAESGRHGFEMVAREDGGGQRYLFITNPSLRETIADDVTVDRAYSRVIDLGISKEFAVPIAERAEGEGAWTRFRVRLAPGEGTVLKLVE